MKRGLLLLASVFFAWFTLAGCEPKHPSVLKNAPEVEKSAGKALANAVDRYWSAFSAHDLETTYAMELPYQRYLHPFDWYRHFRADAKKGFTVTVTKVQKVPDNPNIVYLYLSIDFNGDKGATRDKWIRVGDTWYHKFIDTLLPPVDY